MSGFCNKNYYQHFSVIRIVLCMNSGLLMLNHQCQKKCFRAMQNRKIFNLLRLVNLLFPMKIFRWKSLDGMQGFGHNPFISNKQKKIV